MATPSVRYAHRQTGWPMLVAAIAPFLIVAAVVATVPLSQRSWPPELLPGLAIVSLVLLVGFSSLSVVVTSRQVVARFGIGVVHRTVPLDDIVSIDVVRTRWFDGWGIHWTRRGMLYNVAGFDAVEIRRRDGARLRIGSDDAGRLVAVVRRALADRRGSAVDDRERP